MIEVQNLTIAYDTASGRVRAVDDVSFNIAASEILGLVGESGSGKSSVAMALVGHIAAAARAVEGHVLLGDQDLLKLPTRALASLRGRRIGFVPQNPAMGLSPHLRIGRQFSELVLQHRAADDRSKAIELARELFALVGLPEPQQIADRYPHELSGGQQQRVCIAMAVACRPELLVLDEPTTGLDVTTQIRIIELLKDLRARFGMGMLYVTHDLGLLAQIADTVGVMYAGSLIEIAPAARLFATPRHPYTRALIASVPSLDNDALRTRRLRGLLLRDSLPPGCAFFPRCNHGKPDCASTRQILETIEPAHSVACQRWRFIDAEGTALAQKRAPHLLPAAASGAPLVELVSADIDYARRSVWRRVFEAKSRAVVKDLSLSVREGEVFALVGESGSGKSTIARALSGVVSPVKGEVRFRGEIVPRRLKGRPLTVKRAIQYVFQNPDASLNPRERVRGALRRPLRLYFRSDRAEVERRVRAGLQEVRLDPAFADRFPDQLSGGERQRIAIARGLVAEPSLLLCDEVLSALDVSVQASIIDLLARLRLETGIAMLFISHDLAVVRELADRTGVLFRGVLVEVGPTDRLFEPPFHPYTEELLLAVPAYRRRKRSGGFPRSAGGRSSHEAGCVYAGRCAHYRGRICDEQAPPWRTASSGHAIRCHIPLEELASENLIVGSHDRAFLNEARTSNPEVAV